MKRMHTVDRARSFSRRHRAHRRRRPNDAQIAAIVVTANQVDIDAGKLAESKASNDEVKAFGKQMVTDHTGVNKPATDLVDEAQGHARGQPDQPEPEEGRRGQRREPQDAERRRVRQGLRRPRGRVPPGGARRDGQDADPERAERRAEGAAGQGAAGVRRAPRSREAPAGFARQMSVPQAPAAHFRTLVASPSPRPALARHRRERSVRGSHGDDRRLRVPSGGRHREGG